MDDRLQNMRDSLQDSLDELSSTRSSSEAKTRALQRIERHLALACISQDSSGDLFDFNALQYTFECNVPMRLLAWISASTNTLEALTNKGSMDPERELQASSLSTQLSLSLALIQGVALNHAASKAYLSRKYALEVLIDLLLASRHLSSPSPSPTGTPSRTPASQAPPLSSVVLDTLLCVLVDAPTALRAFEDASGTQAIVKILKRAGTPREVRMKCLEFLYFYLLDENPASPETVNKAVTPVSTPPPTAPATPMKTPKPYLNSRPIRPPSRLGSSEYSLPSNKASSSSSTPRSTSGGSSHSFSSTSSVVSGSTAPSSTSSSPDNTFSPFPPPKTPPGSPRLAPKVSRQLQPRSLMMLRKEVEYEPQSPKKPHLQRLGASGGLRHSASKSISRSKLPSEDDCRRYSQVSSTPSRHDRSGGAVEGGPPKPSSRAEKTRTTEEKKELLGTMLGNVDALVEGVRKAGIWGLG